uniref:Uncharacterized protein n=1 Tax=Rhizophora mucronata TaxID=61149 RepID=A0A2P2N864_RHIMU
MLVRCVLNMGLRDWSGKDKHGCQKMDGSVSRVATYTARKDILAATVSQHFASGLCPYPSIFVDFLLHSLSRF